jgi:hypothetical protein
MTTLSEPLLDPEHAERVRLPKSDAHKLKKKKEKKKRGQGDGEKAAEKKKKRKHAIPGGVDADDDSAPAPGANAVSSPLQSPKKKKKVDRGLPGH